jgi:hypothetical protein
MRDAAASRERPGPILGLVSTIVVTVGAKAARSVG